MASISLFSGSVPDNYDKYLGPILFEPYALDLVERLKNDHVEHLLELACGTGRVTKHLLDVIADKGRLFATDLNPGMLEVAKKKVQSDKIEWQIVNAEDLPFENEQFDHTVCQFGVMFFPDKEKSFKEVYRVLKKGGKYLFSVWESVDKNPRINSLRETLHEVFGNESTDFFQKGPYVFNDKAMIEQLLRNAGFNTVRIDEVSKTSRYNEPDELVKGFVEGSSLSNFLAEKDEQFREHLMSLMRHRLIAQENNYDNTVPLLALVVEATK